MAASCMHYQKRTAYLRREIIDDEKKPLLWICLATIMMPSTIFFT